jgi:pyrrolysine biosynthesis protein PylD
MGYTLEEIARRAVGANEGRSLYESVKVAIVPITSGLGVISGFSKTVCDILKHCQVEATVTEKTDVAGIQEAYQGNADIIFMADDDVCGAFSLGGKVSSDNGYATGASFAAALELKMDQVAGEEVLILGAGPVGIAAAEYFSAKGAIPVICDIIEEKSLRASGKIKHARVEKSLDNMYLYRYILDATTSGDFIKERDITAHTIISAPGMPLGISEEIRDKVFLFHNPLELGIMTMFFDCIHQLKEA